MTVLNYKLSFLFLSIMSITIQLRNGFSLFSKSRKTLLTTNTRNMILMSGGSSYKSSESVDIEVLASSSFGFKGDLLVIPFYKPNSLIKDDIAVSNALKEMIPSSLSADLQIVVSEVLDEHVFKADPSAKQLVRIAGGNQSIKYIALVGLGPDPKKESAVHDLEVSSASRLGKSVATVSKKINAETVAIALSSAVTNAGITPLLLGLHDSSYSDNRYKKESPKSDKKLKSLTLLGCSNTVVETIELTHRLTKMIASGVHFAKDLVGAPPNSKTPVVIADLAKQMAKDHSLQIEILGESECKALNMGGYLGVQQGSKFPPQFIHLTYKPENPSKDLVKVALVGKGLTFDSGGYNLKVGPGSMIELMKFDMGGCGAVLGCAKAIGQLKPKNVEVHFITAVCENMISAEAMRPGDILVTSNGKTIEVLNTDAEGRLTLSDALVFAEKLQVDSIIDLATLTGACIVGLGEKLAGLYSSDNNLKTEIENAAKRTEEGIWSLPLEPQYKELIKSNIADLKNIGGKGGGSITAALFLQEFVEKTPWAHIDMAGPVWDTSNNKPTGYGVKLLVDYLLNVKKTK